MTPEAAAVLRRALALPPGDRANVAAELIESLDGPEPRYSPERAEAWAREVERRIERVVSGVAGHGPRRRLAADRRRAPAR